MAQIKANPGQAFPFVMEMTGYDKLLPFLKTLSEEPDKSLEEAAEEYRRESFKKSVMPQIDGPVSEYGGSIKDAFIAGWKCRDDQMLKDAYVESQIVEDGRIELGGDPLPCLNPIILLPYPQFEPGDKVRIIVLKAEE